MTRSFITNLTLEVKGHSAKQTYKRTYTLNAADEPALMNQALHLAGIQDDLIAANRVAFTNDPSLLTRPPDTGSVTITSQAKDDQNNAVHSATVTWYSLTQEEIDRVLGAINARLSAVGLTI